MNREQITPKIIELARKLYDAGHRQEIRYGDWYWDEIDNECHLFYHGETLKEFYGEDATGIPIPTLTEILDWLLNKTGFLSILTAHIDRKYRWACVYNQNIGDSTEAPTPTEAAYLAMIKILEVEAEQQRKDDEWEAIRPDPQEEGDK